MIGNIWNIDLGKTNARSGKANAAGNLILSNCNSMKTNGMAINAETIHEAMKV